MLLNKIPVLDKGYAALVDSCNTTRKLRDLGQEFYGGDYPIALEQFGSLTVVMKVPLFVQLNLSKFNFRIIDANKVAAPTDAYIPNAGEIGARERADCETISDDISRTTAALLINPTAYQSDGADRFVAQILTPISVYTTIIVQGSYDEWCKWAFQQAHVPAPIKAYTIALQQIITAEWK